MLKRPLSAFVLGACLFALSACDSKDDPTPDAGTTVDAGSDAGTDADAGSTEQPPPVIPEGYTLLVPSSEGQTLPWRGELEVSRRFAFVARAGRHYDFSVEGQRNSHSLKLSDAAGVTIEDGQTLTGIPFTWHWSGFPEGAVYTLDLSVFPAQASGPVVFHFEDKGLDDHGDQLLTATPWVPSEQPLFGVGEHSGERDLFAFETVVDHVYAIDCTFPTQHWRLFFFHPNGPHYDDVDSASFAQTQAATAFKSPGGRHYVFIEDRRPVPSSATYSCVLRDKGLDGPGYTSTELPLGTTSTQGTLDYVADTDSFVLGVLPGHFYRVSCTLAGTTPCIVFAGEGYEQPGDESKAVFKALKPTHFVRVQGDGVIPARWVELPYTLEFEDLGEDDHGDSADTATPLSGPPQTVHARFTGLFDLDVFSFQAVEGQRYQFSSEWREGQGQLFTFIQNEMGAPVKAPRTQVGSRWVQDFTAPKTGTYFIEFFADVEANLGDYTFQFDALIP